MPATNHHTRGLYHRVGNGPSGATPRPLGSPGYAVGMPKRSPQLELLVDGAVAHRLTLADAPVTIGRSTSNRLALTAPDVSSHHAVVWADARGVWVRDLDSRNGTFVDGARVTETVPLAATARLRLGRDTHLRLAAAPQPASLGLRLERLDAPLAWAVSSAAFAIPGIDDAWIVVDERGVWLADGAQDDRPLPLGEPFSIRAQRFRVVEDDTPDTKQPSPLAFPYHLEVSLPASEAIVRHPEGPWVSFEEELRVSLLYTLGARWLADGEGGGRGWMDDEAVTRSVWGRAGREHGANNVNVLVHRVRQRVQQAGMDRWFLEKRAGRCRVRVARVTLRT